MIHGLMVLPGLYLTFFLVTIGKIIGVIPF